MDLIACVVDRSGSMYSIKSDAEGGVNNFLEEQKKQGPARLTLAEFDNDYDLLHDDILLEHFEQYELEPRGGTALFDAIGRTISRVKGYEVNGQKFLVIVTDGDENASIEFTDANVIKEMIEDMRQDGWETIFICGDETAMQQARGLGIDMNTAFMMQKSAAGVADSYNAVGAYTTSMRTGVSKHDAVRSLNATIASSTTMRKSDVDVDDLLSEVDSTETI